MKIKLLFIAILVVFLLCSCGDKSSDIESNQAEEPTPMMDQLVVSPASLDNNNKKYNEENNRYCFYVKGENNKSELYLYDTVEYKKVLISDHGNCRMDFFSSDNNTIIFEDDRGLIFGQISDKGVETEIIETEFAYALANRDNSVVVYLQNANHNEQEKVFNIIWYSTLEQKKIQIASNVTQQNALFYGQVHLMNNGNRVVWIDDNYRLYEWSIDNVVTMISDFVGCAYAEHIFVWGTDEELFYGNTNGIYCKTKDKAAELVISYSEGFEIRTILKSEGDKCRFYYQINDGQDSDAEPVLFFFDGRKPVKVASLADASLRLYNDGSGYINYQKGSAIILDGKMVYEGDSQINSICTNDDKSEIAVLWQDNDYSLERIQIESTGAKHKTVDNNVKLIYCFSNTGELLYMKQDNSQNSDYSAMYCNGKLVDSNCEEIVEFWYNKKPLYYSLCDDKNGGIDHTNDEYALKIYRDGKVSEVAREIRERCIFFAGDNIMIGTDYENLSNPALGYIVSGTIKLCQYDKSGLIIIDDNVTEVSTNIEYDYLQNCTCSSAYTRNSFY